MIRNFKCICIHVHVLYNNIGLYQELLGYAHIEMSLHVCGALRVQIEKQYGEDVLEVS
jgi:hypothetical protein